MRTILLLFSLSLCTAAQDHKVGVAHYALPGYPPIAKQAMVQGDVRLQLHLDGTGKVVTVEPLSGHKMLQDAAVETAKQWQFVCIDCLSTTVLSEHTLTFRFALDGYCLRCYEFSLPDLVTIRTEKPECWAYVTNIRATPRPWYLRWMGRRSLVYESGDVPCDRFRVTAR
jgi:TonB family protein